MQDPAIEDSSDSCARSPSHIPGPPGESWDRSAPDALHWSVSARRGTETCVPSACRNRPSSSQWCNGRATFVCGAWQTNAPHVSRLHRWPLAATSRHVTLYGHSRASSRDRARTRARARQRPSALRIGRMREGSTRRRLRWLVSGPLMAAGERLGRLAYSDGPVPRPTAQCARL